MKDLQDMIEENTERLFELQSCIELLQTVLEVNMDEMGVSEEYGDYPHQMQIVLGLCLSNVKKIKEENINIFKAARK